MCGGRQRLEIGVLLTGSYGPLADAQQKLVRPLDLPLRPG
jgi:hypothetical protein